MRAWVALLKFWGGVATMPLLYGRVETSDGACFNLGPRLALPAFEV